MQKKLFIFVLITLLAVLAAGCGPVSGVQLYTPVPETQAGTPVPSGEINVPGLIIQVYAPGPNPLMGTADAHGKPAGILLGLWHGFISPFTLIASLFYPSVQIYEVHNDGRQYNLGFLLGFVIFFVLVFLAGSRRG